MGNLVEATIVDIIYAAILYYFKDMNKIPMSTTWVFLGCIAGRELGMSFEQTGGPGHDFWRALKISIRDILLAGTGTLASIGLAYAQR